MKLSRTEWMIVIVGFVITAFYAYGHKLDGDVVQLLDRALALIQEGRLIPYGPATSSGASGHVPGAFLSLAVGLPMLIYPSPWFSLGLIALFHFAAFLALRSILRPYLSEPSLIFLALMFWLNPYRASEVFLWNPSFSFFASVFHFWTANQLFQSQLKNEKLRQAFWTFFWSAAHVFSLFLAAQIHPSVIILAGVSVLLWAAGRVKVSWMGVGLGFLLGLASLTPFFIEVLQNPEVFPKPGNSESTLFYGLTHAHPMLKSVWYWILFGSFISQTHVFHKTTFSWIEPKVLEALVQLLFQVIKYFFAVIGVILSFYVNILFARAYAQLLKFWEIQFWQPLRSKETALQDRNRPFFVDFVCCSFLMAVAAAALSPASLQYWHVLFVMPTALVPLVWVIDQIVFSKESKLKTLAMSARHKLPKFIYVLLQHLAKAEKSDHEKSTFWARLSFSRLMFILGVYFVVFNFFAAVESQKYDWSESFQSRFERYRFQ